LMRREGAHGGLAAGVTGGNASRAVRMAGGPGEEQSAKCGAAKWAAEPLHEATVGVVGGALAGDV